MTAARATRLADGLGDPAVDVIGIRFARSMLEMDEELPVSLRAGQSGVYDADRDATPFPRGFDDALENLSLHGGVADNTLHHVSTPRLELRLHENERLPTRKCKPARRRQRLRHADDRDVAPDELGRERQLRQRACVHALENGDPRITSKPWMEL